MMLIYERMPDGYHEQEIGHEVVYTKPNGKKIRGTIVDVRRSPDVTIYDMDAGEYWYAISFKIKPEDGSRAFWTSTYRDSPRADDQNSCKQKQITHE